MADDQPDVSEADIQDVSLINTPLEDSQAEQPSETADKAEDKGADTKEEAQPQEQPKEDANNTEAKEEVKDQIKAPEQEQPEDVKTPEQLREEQQARARAEYQERQRVRAQVAQQLDQNYGPKTEDELVNEGLDPQQAQIEALRQEMAYKEQRTAIAELNAGLQAEAVNVTNDFSVFNEKSPDYDPEFTKMVESQYKTAARLQTDESGIIVNAEVPLYDFYKSMANIYSRGTSKGAETGQAEMQQMLSRTENPGGSSSTSGYADDSLEALEERLGDVVIT
jgi:hypothetical protein